MSSPSASPAGDGARATPAAAGRAGPLPLWAYVAGSVLVWTALQPLADWITGDLTRWGKSAVKGAATGLVFGLSMFAFERWLERRRSRGS